MNRKQLHLAVGKLLPILLVAGLALIFSWLRLDTVFSNHNRYVVVVDAGSTGSRIHVFEFAVHYDNSTPQLLNEYFEKSIRGLSSYETPEQAALSLVPLLDNAAKQIPRWHRKEKKTPLTVKATAGLRLAGPEISSEILASVRELLDTRYPMFDIDSVEIIEGKDEGVFAWVTTNYFLGNIGTLNESVIRRTAAVFELGGGSSQIVFEPDVEAKHLLEPGDHMYELRFGSQHHLLYQHSHLGYGLMEARKKIHRLVTEKATNGSKLFFSRDLNVKGTIENPCISVGQKRIIPVDVSASGEKGHIYNVTMYGPESMPGAETCIEFALDILNKDEECIQEPCSFNGAHQPPLEQVFAKEEMYVFSYFYDRIFPLGVPSKFPLSHIKTLADQVCQGPATWETSFPNSLDELYDRPEYCLDLSFMFAMLHHGYEIPLDRELTIAKRIGKNQLGWCLGSALAMVDKLLEVPEII
jgi:guanosine-diphosphatase